MPTHWKKTVCLFAAAVGLVLMGASPAGANTTDTSHSNTIGNTLPVACGGAGSTTYSGTGNSVQHETVNKTGDWFTTTTEGNVTLTMTTLPATYSGHVQEWFGAEDNNQNGVMHATFNFHGADVSNPSNTLTVHAEFDTTVNANGTTTANHLNINCS